MPVSKSTIAAEGRTGFSVGEVELDLVNVPSCSSLDCLNISIVVSSHPLVLGSRIIVSVNRQLFVHPSSRCKVEPKTSDIVILVAEQAC